MGIIPSYTDIHVMSPIFAPLLVLCIIHPFLNLINKPVSSPFLHWLISSYQTPEVASKPVHHSFHNKTEPPAPFSLVQDKMENQIGKKRIDYFLLQLSYKVQVKYNLLPKTLVVR